MSYSLFAYVLIPTENPDILRCVAKSKSPSFLIVSARRTSDPDIKNSILCNEYKSESPITVIFHSTVTFDKTLQLSSETDSSLSNSPSFIEQTNKKEEEEEVEEEVKLSIPTSHSSILPPPSPLLQDETNEKECSVNDNLSNSFFKPNPSIYQIVINKNNNCKLNDNIFHHLNDDDNNLKPKKLPRQDYQSSKKHEKTSSPLCKRRKSIKTLPDVNTFDDEVNSDSNCINKKYPVIFKVVNTINVNSEREELSFYGNSFHQFLNDENCYLDKYGQKCKLCISSLL